MGRKRKSDVDSAGSLESSNSSCSNLNGLQRLAANDRERTRMRVLSKAFVRLKTSLPWVPSDTKLSKLDTLKLAASYISYLTRILGQDENENGSNSSNSNSSNSNSSDELASVYFQPPSYHSHHHQSSNTMTTTKMLPSIRLSAFDMQRIINNHLSSSSPSSSSSSSNILSYHGGSGNGVGNGDGFQTSSITNTTTNGGLMSHHHHHNMYHHSNHTQTSTSYI